MRAARLTCAMALALGGGGLAARPARSAPEALHGSPDRPLWSQGGRPTPSATRAIALLRAAEDHGLRPSDYDAEPLDESASRLATSSSPAPEDVALFEVGLGAAMLRYLEDVHRGRVDPLRAGFDYHAGESHRASDLLARALARGDLDGAVAEAEPAFAQYARLKSALPHYRALAADATLQPVPVVRRIGEGERYQGLPRLARLLHALGDLANPPEAHDGAPYGGAVREAVERFQARHGLAVDGILGPATFRQLNVPLSHRVRQIELALERLRWLPHAPAGRFLVVNVPAFRLVAFESATSDRPALQMGVVVGRAARTRTPLFADAVRYLIFRPFWYVPRSIIVNELLPAARRNPGYLARERLDIVARGDDHAPALPATPANLARLAAGSLQLRQRSGEGNALGLVKFVFPNAYDVYLHDTPAKGLFARARRDFSHGCIRVENAPALAAFLLEGRPEWTRETIAAAMNGGRTRRVELPAPVPVFIYYTTAIVRADGTVEFFEDIYGKDAALAAAPRRATTTREDDAAACRRNRFAWRATCILPLRRLRGNSRRDGAERGIMQPEPMIDPRYRSAGPTQEEIEAWAAREHKRREAWASGPSEEEKEDRARRWRRRAVFGLEESRLGPTREDIESWAEREQKRRAAWLAGPTPDEKREWARSARARGLGLSDSSLPPSPEEIEAWARREQQWRSEWLAGPTERERQEWARRQGGWPDLVDLSLEQGFSGMAQRFFREAELAGKGSLFALTSAPGALWSYFVRAGRAFEEEFYQPARRRRVRF